MSDLLGRLGAEPVEAELNIKENLLTRGAHGCLYGEQPLMNARLLIWPRHHLVSLEGRLQAILAANANDRRLAPLARLGAAAEQLKEEAERWELSPLGEAQVRRLDVAADCQFSDPVEGHAFLDGLATFCPPPGRKSVIWRGPAGVETVSLFRTTGHKRALSARIYDKGLALADQASGGRNADPSCGGQLVRVEIQRRFPKRATSTAREMAAAAAEYEWFDEVVEWSRQFPARRGALARRVFKQANQVAHQ